MSSAGIADLVFYLIATITVASAAGVAFSHNIVYSAFALMLTHRIADVRISNRSVGRWPALLILAFIGVVMGQAILTAPWYQQEPAEALPTAARLGNAFLTDYVLPFELASVVLLAALIGAVVLSRKELRSE